MQKIIACLFLLISVCNCEIFVCPLASSAGLYSHPTDKTKFYSCAHGIATEFDCPSGLVFDETIGVCVFPTDDTTLPTSPKALITLPITLPTIHITLPTILPTLPTILPTLPVNLTLPTILPTLPTILPTLPVNLTLPTILPTLPTILPTLPVNLTLPTILPTLPTILPTLSVNLTLPTIPTILPTLPTILPTLPTILPTLPVNLTLPTIPTILPTLPTILPTLSVNLTLPTIPSILPTLPVNLTLPTILPTLPVNLTLPSLPITLPTLPTNPDCIKFSLKNCGPSDSPIQYNNAILTPCPIKQFEPIKLITDIKVVKNISSSKLILKTMLEQVSPIHFEFPCIGGFGSCTTNVCTDTQLLFSQIFNPFGANSCNILVGEFLDYEMDVSIPPIDSLLANFLEGEYEGNGTLFDEETNEVISCVHITFALQ